jgi:flagellar basal-body rod protein FlgG
MWTAYRVAAAGVQAHEHALDVAANNLANVQTTAFRARRPNLVDLPPGASTFALTGLSGGIELVSERVGVGATWESPRTIQAPGAPLQTGRPLDVAIEGSGYFAVALPDGSVGYTRDGFFRLDSDGSLMTSTGLRLAPPIVIPDGVTGLTIQSDGLILGDIGNQRWALAQLQLTPFRNPDGLIPRGHGLYEATPAAGEGTPGTPGQDGLGRLSHGFLEGSNVDVADELVRTLQAQRAYQVNLRALRTVDEMVQEANTLGR